MYTLINVCGLGRSGTTIMDLMLGNACNAFSCGELYAWYWPYRTHHFNIVCSCPDDPCKYWSTIKFFPKNVCHKRICETFNFDFVIDSSKDLMWVLDSNVYAIQNKMNVYNVLMWKEPIDACYSQWKRNLPCEIAVSSYVNYYSRFLSLGLPYISVGYSDFIKNPEEELRILCRLIGMEYFKGKVDFYEKRWHHHLFGSLGTRKQIGNTSTKITNPIRSTRTFPGEFLDHVKTVLQDSGQRAHDVHALASILKKSEISNLPESAEIAQPKGFDRIKPWWYYAKRTYYSVKRYFPEEWKYEQ